MSEKVKTPTLIIPPLKGEDWEEAIQEAEGIEKQLLLVQVRTVNLLKYIDDLEANSTAPCLDGIMD